MDSKLQILKQNSIQAAPGLATRTLKDCARLLQTLGEQNAILKLKDLQAFWLSVMADKSASHKDRLQASKLYAESIGAFNKDSKQKGVNGANIHWRTTPIDVEIVSDDTLEN